jgi:hypothetical protein
VRPRFLNLLLQHPLVDLGGGLPARGQGGIGRGKERPQAFSFRLGFLEWSGQDDVHRGGREEDLGAAALRVIERALVARLSAVLHDIERRLAEMLIDLLVEDGLSPDFLCRGSGWRPIYCGSQDGERHENREY